MSKYLALQIYKEKLDYDEIILKYPLLKETIDEELEMLQGGE